MVNVKLSKKYIKLRSIVKNWGTKKIKTKNILADWRKLNVRKKLSRISVDRWWNPATTGSHVKLKSWKRLQWAYLRINPGLTSDCMVVTLDTKCKMTVLTFYSFLSILQESGFHSRNHSTVLNYDVVLPSKEVMSVCFSSSHFAFWSQSS